MYASTLKRVFNGSTPRTCDLTHFGYASEGLWIIYSQRLLQMYIIWLSNLLTMSVPAGRKDTKGVIRRRADNTMAKRTNYDLQNITQETKEQQHETY